MEDIRQVNVRGTLYNVTSTANINMAPIEDGDTASQAYAINKLMIFKGYLCKTTTTIAQGDTLEIGVNLAYDTIATEIEGLSDGIGGSTDTFRFGTDGNGEYGYIKKVGGADTFFPFKTKHTETVTPTSRAQVDMGEYHKKRYVTLTSVPNNNTTTYSATARGASIDMGATNTHRYVDTTAVPNTNSGTYSVTTNGTHDMGATNTYRYVSVNVPIPPVSNAYEVRGAWNAVHLDMTFDVSQATGTLTFHSVKPNQFGWNQTQIIADGTTIYTCPADKLDDTQSVNVTPYSTIRIINLGAGSGCSQNWSFS